MKTALAICPRWDILHPVSSLALFSAELSRRGHDVRLLDLNQAIACLELTVDGPLAKRRPTPGDPWTDPAWIEREFLSAYGGWLEDAVRGALDDGVRLFGFSTYYSNAWVTLAVARMVKRLEPSAAVVLGGPSCLTFKECVELLAHECVDAVALGEADRSFPRLVDDLARTGELRPSPGILLRADRSTWKDAQDRPERLDELPFADFSGFSFQGAYIGKTIHTTRGCVRRCNFCADWREMPYRHMSGARVHAEMTAQLERHPRIKRFLFGDSVLNGSIETVEGFCGRLLADGAAISWSGYAIARPEMAAPLLAKMRRAGCEELFYGVESGSQEVLVAMDKRVPPRLNAAVLRATREAGIKTVATWIVGFPTETEETFQESLRFIRDNAASITKVTPSLFSIVEVKDQAERLGIATTESDLFWSSRDGTNTFETRVDRLGRLLETAADCGVEASYQGIIAPADFPAYRERLLAMARPSR